MCSSTRLRTVRHNPKLKGSLPQWIPNQKKVSSSRWSRETVLLVLNSVVAIATMRLIVYRMFQMHLSVLKVAQKRCYVKHKRGLCDFICFNKFFHSYPCCLVDLQFLSVPQSSAWPATVQWTSRSLGSPFQTSWVVGESLPTACPIGPVQRAQSLRWSSLERKHNTSWKTCSPTPSTCCVLLLPPV